jgi:hypothetical protein
LFSQPGLQIKPDLAVRFVVLVDPADHRGERLSQIGAADDADELAVLDYRDALDALTLEESCDVGEPRLLGNRDHARRHDFADLLAVRLGEFFGSVLAPVTASSQHVRCFSVPISTRWIRSASR